MQAVVHAEVARCVAMRTRSRQGESCCGGHDWQRRGFEGGPIQLFQCSTGCFSACRNELTMMRCRERGQRRRRARSVQSRQSGTERQSHRSRTLNRAWPFEYTPRLVLLPLPPFTHLQSECVRASSNRRGERGGTLDSNVGHRAFDLRLAKTASRAAREQCHTNKQREEAKVSSRRGRRESGLTNGRGEETLRVDQSLCSYAQVSSSLTALFSCSFPRRHRKKNKKTSD